MPNLIALRGADQSHSFLDGVIEMQAAEDELLPKRYYRPCEPTDWFIEIHAERRVLEERRPRVRALRHGD